MLLNLSFLLTLHTVLAQFLPQIDRTVYGPENSEITVEWPVAVPNRFKLGELDSGRLLLCTCRKAKYTCHKIKDNIDIKHTSSVTIPISDISSLGTNGWYNLQFVAINSHNPQQYLLTYTHGFFHITSGMTGSEPAEKNCGIPEISPNDVPGTASTVIWPSYTLPTEYQAYTGVSSSLMYLIPYTWQKGPVRMAPLQVVPQNSITIKSTPSRRYPTSPYTPFTTYFFNPYLPTLTKTIYPVLPPQQVNFAPTIATTPSGVVPSRVMPSLQLPSASSSAKRRRRWED